MKILWLSGNPALYKRKSMIDGGWMVHFRVKS